VNFQPEETKYCDPIREDLVEFALGTLSGRSRSRVLDHLESCSSCSAELASMAAVADTMLWLAPEAEPPLGFEMRVVERFRNIDGRRAVTRRRSAAVWAVAAALVAVVGFGLGAMATSHNSTNQISANARPTMARLTANGHDLGQVFLSSGNPSWIMMTVDGGSRSGVVWCEVTLTSGRTETIGEFALSRGYGSWIAPFNGSGSQVRSAQLVDAKGTVLARASLKV